MIANKQNNSYQNDFSFVTPTPSDAEIAEKKKLEEEAYAFDVWAAQNGYSFINSEGEFDLDAYEQAKKIYEVPHEDVPETITVEPKDVDSNDFKLTASINPVNTTKEPRKTSEKKSYSQQLIKKIERDATQMDMPLDSIPDDEDFFGS